MLMKNNVNKYVLCIIGCFFPVKPLGVLAGAKSDNFDF